MSTPIVRLKRRDEIFGVAVGITTCPANPNYFLVVASYEGRYATERYQSHTARYGPQWGAGTVMYIAAAECAVRRLAYDGGLPEILAERVAKELMERIQQVKTDLNNGRFLDPWALEEDA